MRFSFVMLAVFFMLFVNILYAGMQGVDFNLSFDEKVIDCEKSKVVESPSSYCETWFIKNMPAYNDCLDYMKAMPPPYCIDIHPSVYLEESTKEVNVVSATQRLTTALWSIITVPFNNEYMAILNLGCYIVIAVWAYKAILPTTGDE